MKSSLLLIPIVIFCSILLFTQEIQTAFADVVIQVITPTGGNLSSASDCSGIGGRNGIIWMECNDILYAISETTNTVLANSTVSTTGAVIFAMNSGTAVLFVDIIANTVTKYVYSSATTPNIQITGVWAPSSCDLIGRDSFQYDVTGFVWTVCNSQDTVIKFSPATMTTTRTSQDLTDGAGIECGSVTKVAYFPADNIGVIRCTVPSSIVTFSQTTTTTVTLLDDEAEANIALEHLSIDGNTNRIFAVDGTDFQVYNYSVGGIISALTTITGNNFEQCVTEQLLTNLESDFRVDTVCIFQGGGGVILTGFASNSTGVTQILNGFASSLDVADIGLRYADNQAPFTVLTSVYYASSTSNNQKYVKISDLNTAQVEPEPPIDGGGGGGGSTGGVDCTLPENENLLTCRIGGDGAIGGGGAFIIGNTTGSIGVVPILCNVGIVDCVANPDMKTNGTGLIFTIIAIMVTVGIFWVASRGDLGAIPMFIWFIAVLGILGFATIANLIDATFLILGVVAMIALATVKLRGLFGGEFK